MKRYLQFALLSFILSSCLVNKPDSKSISNFDYNYRRDVQQAHYIKKRSPIGLSVIVGSTIAGASIGLGVQPFAYYSGQEKKSSGLFDATLGGLLGYGIAHVVEIFLGHKKSVAVENPRKWVRKANSNYMLTKEFPKGSSSFSVMHEDAEGIYTFKNIKDAQEFAYVFPKSKRTDEIIDRDYNNIARNDLPELLRIFPKTVHSSAIKDSYLTRSNSLTQCIEAKNTYPELYKAAEKKSVEYVLSVEKAVLFNREFANSSYAEQVVTQVIKYALRNDLPELLRIYPNTVRSAAIKELYLTQSNSFEQCIEAKNTYPELYKAAEKKSAEYVNSVENAVVFSREFANSSYAEQVVTQAIKSASRAQLPQLVDIYPQLDLAKQAYIQQSGNLTEYIEATDRYSINNTEKDKMAITFIKSYNDVELYHQKFGINNDNITDVYRQSIDNIERQGIALFLEKYESYLDNNLLHEGKLKYVDKSQNIEECYEAYNRYPMNAIEAELKAYSLVFTLENANDYFRYFPQGIHINEVNTKTNTLISDEISLLYNKPQKSLDNFVGRVNNLTYLHDKESKLSVILSDHNRRKQRYEELLSKTDLGSQGFKVVFNVKNGQYSEEYIEQIKKIILSQGESESFFGANKTKYVEQIMDVSTIDNKGIITAMWYRKGEKLTDSFLGLDIEPDNKGGYIISKNKKTKFSIFSKDITKECAKINVNIVSCSYMGNYDDDIQDKIDYNETYKHVKRQQHAMEHKEDFYIKSNRAPNRSIWSSLKIDPDNVLSVTTISCKADASISVIVYLLKNRKDMWQVKGSGIIFDDTFSSFEKAEEAAIKKIQKECIK